MIPRSFPNLLIKLAIPFGSWKVCFDDAKKRTTHNVVTVTDVLERVAVNYTKNTKLKLVNEHKVQTKKNAMVEKGRTYQINRFY